jgi:hypothetical protein
MALFFQGLYLSKLEILFVPKDIIYLVQIYVKTISAPKYRHKGGVLWPFYEIVIKGLQALGIC